MNNQRYTLPAIALHWGQAVLVVWLLWLGWTMTDLPKGAERRQRSPVAGKPSWRPPPTTRCMFF